MVMADKDRDSLPSPWAKVVRGGEVEEVEDVHQSPPSSSSSLCSLGNSAAPEQTPFSDCSSNSRAARSSPPLSPPMADDPSATVRPNGHNGNAARPKKAAWNKPSDGVIEVSPVTVMDAISWPALSESTRASPKLPADSSPKTVSDATVTHGSVPVSQGPVITQLPNSKRHTTNNANPNSTSNHAFPARQRPIKRGGGGSTGSGHAHSGYVHPSPPPPPPPFPVFPILSNGYGNLVPVMPEPSPRYPSFRGNSWDARAVGGFVPQSQPVNDYRNASRRGNFGHHPRGNGPYHNNHNHGGNRDLDRGNYMNVRDVHMHQHRAPPPRGLVRPAPLNTAVFPPQPGRPFPNPIGFTEFVYIPTLPLEQFISQAPHPPMFAPPVAESPLPSLPSSIVSQIDYYFSDANLITDNYLKDNMDGQGWVPISLIATFPRVKALETSIQKILDSLRASSNVEVQDDKVRRRHGWMKWIPTSKLSPESSSPSPSAGLSSYNTLATSFEKLAVEEVARSQNNMVGKPDPNSLAIPESSAESIGQSLQTNGDVAQDR